MNPTTSVTPSTVRRSPEKLDSSAAFLLMILRFSLIKWLAQQQAFVTLAKNCTELLGTRVTPREVVAYLHANVALIAVIFPTNMPGVYYLLTGIWVTIASLPLIGFCRRLVRDWCCLLFNTLPQNFGRPRKKSYFCTWQHAFGSYCTDRGNWSIGESTIQKKAKIHRWIL